jgi:hypothetical protein
MVAALDAHADCGIAHCALRVEGEGAAEFNDWWRQRSPFALSSKELLDRQHIRRAPYDGLLHLNGESVYISLTQLLIRRALFERIGFFDGRWGGAGDFHWDMRASLVTNTVHVPHTWGGWRLHAEQATHGVRFGTAEHRSLIEEMIDDAIACAWSDLPDAIRAGLTAGWRIAFRSEWDLQQALRRQPDRIARAAYLLRKLPSVPGARTHLCRRLLPAAVPPADERVRRWLRSVDGRPPLVAA